MTTISSSFLRFHVSPFPISSFPVPLFISTPPEMSFFNHKTLAEMSRHTGNDVTLLPLITFFAMYLSLCTSLNETVCSCAVILVDCTGIASTGVGSHGCMPLHVATTVRILPCEFNERVRGA